MTENAEFFDDAAAYETLMGRWSRLAGTIFLDWVAPPKNARWLDVGCGTGVCTHLVVETAWPRVGVIDSSPIVSNRLEDRRHRLRRISASR